MAKKAKPIRTPSQVMWSMIKAEMVVQGVTQRELAKRVHCCNDTICLDAKEPERIPQQRLWLYFAALGMDCMDVLRAVAADHAERLTVR